MRPFKTILILSILLMIYFPLCAQFVYAQDWHFMDESATRLPDTNSISEAVTGAQIFGTSSVDILVGQQPDIIRGLPGVAQLLINNGAGNFTLADSSTFPQRNDFTTVIMLFDMDGDGYLDAMVANANSITDYIAKNNGSGIFNMDWSRLPIDTANALVGDYADIDNDGDIDACLLGNNQDRYSHRLWINDGQGYFHDEISRLPFLYDLYRFVGFADLNGDLSPDILAVGYDGYQSQPTVFINDGTGHFADETSMRLPPLNGYCPCAALVDVNNDGHLDIILSHDTRLIFLINDGNGYFTDESNERGPLFPQGNGLPYDIKSLDADNDDDEDLVLGTTVNHPDLIFINDGIGHYSNETDIRWPNQAYGTYKIFLGDLNGDGVGDIFRVGFPSSKNRIFINTLNSPDSIAPHIMNQTILPSIDTSRGPYPVKLVAKDGIAIPYQLSVHVHYSTEGMTFSQDSMHYTGAYIYYGTIPEVDSGQTVYYYYTAEDKWNNISYAPANAPESVFSFIYLPGYTGIEEDGKQIPSKLSITAYPNPFNSDITIIYSASNLGPQPPEIKLLIYDIEGRVIRTLVDEHKPQGTYRVSWDGKDDSGNKVASGTYLAKLSQWGMTGDIPVKITLVK